jgi:beta-mannosidase
VTARAAVALPAGPHAVARARVPAGLVEDVDAGKEFWIADCQDLRAVHFAAADKDFAYPDADYRIDLAADGDAARITVTALTLVRDLVLQADRLHPSAVTDRGRVTLLPGEQVTHTVTGWPAPDARAVPAALFCVNAAPASAPAPGRGSAATS